MEIFWAVLVDLKNFLVQSLFGRQNHIKTLSLPAALVSEKKANNLIDEPVSEVIEKVDVINYSPVSISGEFGFICEIKTNVFDRAVVSYDGVIAKLKYGDKVTVNVYEGRFAQVTLLSGIKGWILKDHIEMDVKKVHPILVSGNSYDAKNSETIKLRNFIQDEFFAKDLFLSLQPEEVVLYYLKKKNLNITWSSTRPRQAGSWQQILKGGVGINIGVVPKAGSVIEYWKEDGLGWVGYTESVMVDESILIKGVGSKNEGEYIEEVVPKHIWQEWRPVWISVT